MRETRSDGQNGSDQSDYRKNIEDRLVGDPDLGLRSQTGDLGLGLGLQTCRQLGQFGGQEAVHLVDARSEAI
jgi:hypothetical protein